MAVCKPKALAIMNKDKPYDMSAPQLPVLIGNIVNQTYQTNASLSVPQHAKQSFQRAEHTSWRCASFFLADRLRCFSNTVQYFSVSLSYFFLASYGIKMENLSQLKQTSAVRRLACMYCMGACKSILNWIYFTFWMKCLNVCDPTLVETVVNVH